LASEFNVVHLQILHAPACLASPAIALEHLPMQLAIAARVESQTRTFAANSVHEAV
jgi:hypothetical protein